MITYMLDQLGLDPSAAIGGTMRQYGSAARAGKGEYFVAEADESDGSFLKYRPFVGVLTNVAPDHMEFFKDEARLLQAFKDYLERIDPEEGVAVIGWDNAMSRQVGSAYTKNRLTYGFLLGSEVRAFDYQSSHGESTFAAIVEKDRVACRLNMMGRHNVQNALCSLAVARALGLDVKQAAAALAAFPGVDRRMALVHAEKDLKIFDDYAHNPGKIAAGVQTLKEAFPESKLHVVFQAHRYSRLETMYDDMLGSVEGADFVHVVPVYAAGEATDQDFSPGRLAQDLKQNLGVNALACKTLADAVQSVREHLRRPAVILTVGAGDVHKVATTLKDGL
jgi:UDP-N-acetylmuramate--alanine ligase